MGYHDEEEHGHGMLFGIAALAIGALIGMALSPESGKKNRMRARNWMNDMKRELGDKVRSSKDMSQNRYNETVDELSRKYSKLKDISQDELHDFVRDLKMRWDRIRYKWEQENRKNPEQDRYANPQYRNDDYYDDYNDWF